MLTLKDALRLMVGQYALAATDKYWWLPIQPYIARITALDG